MENSGMHKHNTTHKLKKIGLIGGTGPESTLVYYKEINRIVNEKMGGTAFPEMMIESVDLYLVLKYCRESRYDELTSYLLEAIHHLADGGAEFAALTAGTTHVVYDKLAKETPIPLISIPETVCQEAMTKSYKKIGLLGTIFTMEEAFFKVPFEKNGMEIVIPQKDDRNLINERIYNELEHGIVKESTRKEMIDMISEMKRNSGIEAIILGCTELPLILNDENSPVPCLDIMNIHIKELVRKIVE